MSQTHLLWRLDGDGVFLWDGDLHWFGGVVLVTLEGSSELDNSQRLKLVKPWSVTLLWTRHTLTMATPWAALQRRGAVREACVGAISNGSYGVEPLSQGLHCAVCSVFARVGASRSAQRLSGARAGSCR